jgi:hypothetical protein
LSSFTGKNFVFIVGSPRSGTTWLQRLLAFSPLAHTGPESYVFASYVGPQLRSWQKELSRRRTQGDDQKGKTPRLVGLSTYLSQDQYLSILRSYLGSLLEAMTPEVKPGDIFLEKTPDHALFAKEISQLLPECKIIHILRDPRDVVASILRTHRVLGWELSAPDPRSAARVWRAHVKGARSVSDLASAGRFLEVRYEELLASTVDQVAKAMDFIGLPHRDAELAQAVEAHSAERVREGASRVIHIRGEAVGELGETTRLPKDFVGKATMGNWKEDLSAMEKFWVWYEVGDYMKECGYSWSPPWWYQPAKRLARTTRGKSE